MTTKQKFIDLAFALALVGAAAANASAPRSFVGTPPPFLPTAEACAQCGECLRDRGILRDHPSILLQMPDNGVHQFTRVTGLLFEDKVNGRPFFSLMMGPYVAGGGHRMLLREYLLRSTRQDRRESVLRWGGEKALEWNGRCFRLPSINESSGMIAKRELEKLPIAYEPMAIDEVAEILAQLTSPICLGSLPKPMIFEYDPRSVHLSGQLNRLSAKFPSGNLRHDLANAQMVLLEALYFNSKRLSPHAVAEMTRMVCGATRTFFEVSQAHDSTAWQAVDQGIAERVRHALQIAEDHGVIAIDAFEEVMDLLQKIGGFRGAVELRAPATSLVRTDNALLLSLPVLPRF